MSGSQFKQSKNKPSKVMPKSAKSAKSDAVEPLIAGELQFVPLSRLLSYTPAKGEGEAAEPMGNRPLDKKWVADLAASIEAHGLDTPLAVWVGPDGGTTSELTSGKVVPSSFLVSGFHRRAALKQLFSSNEARYKELFPQGIPCLVRGGDLKDCIAAQLRENLLRKNPSEKDILPQMLRLRDTFGMKSRDIAKAINKSASFVSQVFAIDEELGEEAVTAVAEGKVGLQDAKDAAQKSRKDKKAGKPAADKKEVVAKLKDKTKKKADSGREREERRLSVATVLQRYDALPNTGKLGANRRVVILEKALRYLAKEDGAELPEELAVEAKKPAAGDDDEV